MILRRVLPLSCIMRGQLAHIFQQECRGSLKFNDFSQIEEQSSANIVEALHRPNDAKGLAWESCHQDVVVRDRFGWNRSCISKWFNAKVMAISASGFRINIAREYAFHPQLGSGYVKSAYSAKHVGEGYGRCRTIRHGTVIPMDSERRRTNQFIAI